MSDLVDFLTIVPTFRRPEQLRAAVRSVLRQEAISTQIVVVDDCPDGSAEAVVKEYPEVLYLKNPQPSGGWPGRVRNYGAQHMMSLGTRAHYLHFLDDDDTIPPGIYHDVKKAFEQKPDVGVVCGVMRPFCEFSIDPGIRAKQETQLSEVVQWRQKAARYPWLFEQVGEKFPAAARWLYKQHARFGSEMVLCSGCFIRSSCFSDLGGFPDVRITQDFELFTAAIRKFGVLFLKREGAGYGLGSVAAIWNPLDLDETAKAAHTAEWMQELQARQKAIQRETGFLGYFVLRAASNLQRAIVGRVRIPLLDRFGHFVELDALTNPGLMAPPRSGSWAQDFPSAP